MENIFLVRVKTPIHLFTYSPIHLFTASLPSVDLGVWNQNGAKPITSTRIGRMRLKPRGQQPTPNCAAVMLICWYTTNYPVELQRSFGTCSVVLEIKRKMDNFSLVGVKTPIHLFTYSPIHLFTFLEKYLKKRRRNSN